MFGNIPAFLRSLPDAALGLVYPDLCQICRNEKATRAEGYVGAECQAKVQFVEPPYCERCGLPYQGEITGPFECANCSDMELEFSAARSAVAATGPVLEAIHHYKYDAQLWFEDFLVELLVAGARPWFLQHATDALIPVPLHPVRQRERGFNQAERLAQRLGAAVEVPIRSELLRRVLPTESQTHLSRGERASNMRHAFALNREEGIRDQSFVLIDDVFTTGATTNACARLLRKAGARRVCVWTVARATFHG